MAATHPILTVSLFGGFLVEYDGATISSLSPRADSLWTLFRYLVANRGKFVTSASLIDILWQEDDVINPRKALQNLVYRLRKQLPEADAAGRPYILSQYRAYGWNPSAEVYVDAFEFDDLAAQIKAGLPDVQLETAVRRLMDLYTGDYMEDISDENWVEPLISHYKRQYFDCVNLYVSVLQEKQAYATIIEICSAATQHNMFDEHYHALIICAMLAQGNRYGAMSHYKSIAALLKKELGVEPSDELKAAGQNISAVGQLQKPDISMVLDDLRAASSMAGPLFCDMEVFRQFFQLQERKSRRENEHCMLVMYTIVAQTRALSDQDMFQAMSLLKRACMLTLRKSDIMTQHSNTQLLLLLPSCTEMNISIVLMRVQQKFSQLCTETSINLTTQVRSLFLQPNQIHFQL